MTQETKNSVIAILLAGIAIILLLASFGKAGPGGAFIYGLFSNVFGIGYYLFPTIAVSIAGAFLFSKKDKFFSVAFIGGSLFILAGLGLIDIIFPSQSGLLGNLIGAMELLLGAPASIVLTATVMIAGLLIALNASLRFSWKDKDEKGEAASKNRGELRLSADEREKPIVIKTTEPIIAAPATQMPIKAAKIVESEESEKLRGIDEEITLPKVKIKSFQADNYTPPPLSLLKSSVEKPTVGDLRANANIIKRTLESFGIPVEMGEINIGPKVTRYTLKPAEGVKLSRLTALNPDLALALAAHPIRIEAPIPGKSLVGVEVPNKSAAIVRLGSLIGYQDFQNAGPLAFVVGRDVTGDPIITDIEKMPHLLIAGATGSGKSVSIHAMIISLLYKNSPANLRMILIDPKRVELSVYSKIPHLVTPVITEGKKTIGVFRWVIQEMERRYQTLLEAGARDIRGFNKTADQPLPYLLLVIDELADLMATYGREIESSIVRLAQMARATGIHLVVSTQRPSVEVITGLIKANITSRVAMQVASQVDSRTILDMAGAEKLLGGGDLLFISSEFSKPKRIQGAYISEEEVKKITEFISENNELIAYENVAVDQSRELFRQTDGEINFDEFSEDGDDEELFKEAVEVVKEAKKASASLLQRRLKVGYARAARLLDMMEAKGLIGPGDGAKPREILIDIGGNNQTIDNNGSDTL